MSEPYALPAEEPQPVAPAPPAPPTLEQRVWDLERIAHNLASETGNEGYRPQLVARESYLG